MESTYGTRASSINKCITVLQTKIESIKESGGNPRTEKTKVIRGRTSIRGFFSPKKD